MVKKILFFASGNGSNVENIVHFFEQDKKVEWLGVMTNNPQAGVIERGQRLGIKVSVFSREEFTNGRLLGEVQLLKPDWIVLAGFLWKIGPDWITHFPNQIINIHPALLPKYGGKGMYGNHVHQAVKENGELETGITIHFVNEEYDRGAFIHQAKVALDASDDVKEIAAKVHALEYEHFPRVIATLLNEREDDYQKN